MLLQDANDLLFAETAFPHRLSPRLENRLTSNRGLFRGARQSLLDCRCGPLLRKTCTAANQPSTLRRFLYDKRSSQP
ncbi:hypothetical protein CCR90_16945 [Rhodovulum sulfidophilum]|nr:hypothetical protein [Rhodovulum sulfidophilum]